MTNKQDTLTANLREANGSRAARRLRRQGLLPINVYDRVQGTNVSASLSRADFERFFDSGHRATVLVIDGEEIRSVVKEVQYDGMGTSLIHVDFARLVKGEKIEVSVAIQLLGVPKGISAGGVLEQPLKDLRVIGEPQHVPDHIEIHVEHLGIDAGIRIQDVPVPPFCEFDHDPDELVLQVVEAAAEPESAAETAATEPELIEKKRAEEEK